MVITSDDPLIDLTKFSKNFTVKDVRNDTDIVPYLQPISLEIPSDVQFADPDKLLSVHFGVECDVCEMSPINGVRYKCCDCDDYDLCEKCHNDGQHSQHKMMKILSQQNK